MTWQESVARAIQRLTSRTGNKLFTRQALIDSELRQIISEVTATGEAPDQALNRVLQDLRRQGMIEFQSLGVYRLLR